MTTEAWCCKCKCKREMINPIESTTKNGRIINKSKCEVCQTTICRMGKIKKDEN